MASLTNTNCVLNEIRRDVEKANNLNPLLASKPDYIPSNLQDLCVDYTAFKAMVLANATKYENLWKESLALKSLGGNITEEGTNFVVKLNMTVSQNSVIVFQNPLILGITDEIENPDNEGITVFTNPLTNQFHIHIIDRKASTIELSVFDIGGKMISAPKITRADTDFMYDASTLQKGVYLLKIILDNKTQVVRKIVKI
jgi:hypothetical protein